MNSQPVRPENPYPIEVGAHIRVQKPFTEQSYDYGFFSYVDKNLDVCYGDRRTGHSRTARPERVQVKALGPQGGVTWTPLIP